MKKGFLALAPVLLLTASGSIYAESQFAGLYVGAHIGYFESDDEGKEYSGGSFSDYTEDTSPNGEFFGIAVGVNKVFGNNILAGIELDYDYRGKSDSSVQDFEGVPDGDYPVETEVKDAASLRGKVGYLFNNDQTVAYITGGYAIANIEREVADVDAGEHESESNLNEGWTAGLGLSHLVTDNLSAYAEYRYTEMDKENMDVSELFSGTVEKYEYEEEAIRIGVAYHF